MQYRVMIAPATCEGGVYSFVISHLLGTPGKRHDVEANTLDDLVSEVRSLACASGHDHCVTSITVPPGVRKPRGFDNAIKPLQFITTKIETA